MIPGPGEYLSLLMNAPSLTEAQLEEAGVRIVERFGPNVLGLLIESSCIPAYQGLVRDRLQPGYWNESVGRDEILFVFKLVSGAIEEFTLSEENQGKISRLCSELNGEPPEKTSDLPAYLAAHPFYADAMIACHGTLVE